MEKIDNILLKGLFVALTLAASKRYMLNVDENQQIMLASTMTILTLMFSCERFVDPLKDFANLKHKSDEILVADTGFAARTLSSIQSTLTQLTPKETDVLSFLAKGSKNNEIAKKLGVSTTTVRNHLNSIIRKLNTSLTPRAVVKAVRHSLTNVTNALDFYHYHKGSTCSYKSMMCQEGWCSECSVCRENSNTSRI
jgi:DNA-binding CsgD family transcriptional regulator